MLSIPGLQCLLRVFIIEEFILTKVIRYALALEITRLCLYLYLSHGGWREKRDVGREGIFNLKSFLEGKEIWTIDKNISKRTCFSSMITREGGKGIELVVHCQSSSLSSEVYLNFFWQVRCRLTKTLFPGS